ncbi:MAG TPA: malto-oligosyltrehalose trehalohydrolase [Usitatibacter sp.]|nr:malto-oligosyltrehalose trehalohydrolase [Usitatibacter sp.]
MKRRHSMPFGAEPVEGGTRFALWAPKPRQVHLVLGRDNARKIAMQREDDGWHRLVVPDVVPGTAYAFDVGEGTPVPDPASRSNPWDVNGPSQVVDPADHEWDDASWRGRPWHEAVVYELHIGTFTPEGTFAAAIAKLDHLVETGITALEVMPVSDFSGARNWGYDGVLPYAPDSAYGSPADFKRFIAEAHKRGLMVLLDVVYNHFGPEGNHLSRYAPQFFNEAKQTPWGAAINFDGDNSQVVRDFFVQNALYWVNEYHLDGLRLDAVHAIHDESRCHVVREIAHAFDAGPRRERHVHLVVENENNGAALLDAARGEPHATAQWADDWHHAAHVLLSGEDDGYYQDFAQRPAWQLARALAEGFAYQGDASAHRKGAPRGEPSGSLALTAFMPFLQNHDQVGNRALGERLATLASPEALRLGTAALLLAPQVPLVFMGEELGARTPFLFFCDFHGDLARAVREGRRKEFAAFAKFSSPEAREKIPDPTAESTFNASKIDWGHVDTEWLAFFRAMLALRREFIVPRLAGKHRGVRFEAKGKRGVAVDWTFGDGSVLHLRANFSSDAEPALAPARGAIIHSEGDCSAQDGMPAWGGIWTLEPA